MYLVDVFISRQKRTELSQSVARIIITAMTLLYLLVISVSGQTFPYQQLVVWVVVALLFYAVGLNAVIRHYPSRVVWRRGMAMTIDLGALSFLFYLSGSFSGTFYPLFLWVIVGNGLRFGVRYLLSATVIAVVFLSFAMMHSDFWRLYLGLSSGLVIGLAILPLFYVVILRELEATNKKLQEQIDVTAFAATHDSLTGLPNRFLFMDRLVQAIDRSKRNKSRFAILFIDLDKFKHINDTLGHALGDDVLQNIASRLRDVLRDSDSVARLGGDEFIVLLSDLTSRQNAQQAAQRIVKIFNVPFNLKGHKLMVTGSVGISIFPDDAEDIDKLINCSDVAMYKAKNIGGNTFKSFSQITEIE